MRMRRTMPLIMGSLLMSTSAGAQVAPPSSCELNNAILVVYGTKLQSTRDALEVDVAKLEAERQRLVAENTKLKAELDAMKPNTEEKR